MKTFWVAYFICVACEPIGCSPVDLNSESRGAEVYITEDACLDDAARIAAETRVFRPDRTIKYDCRPMNVERF
jgi:hypothetical protein